MYGWADQSSVENTVVLIGNSQIHAINHYQKRQLTVPSILFNTLNKDNLNGNG
jgi:hypothetical protein